MPSMIVHLLTPDLTCLEQVVSNRRSYQDYLLKSLEASNQLKQSNVELEAELSRYIVSFWIQTTQIC